MAEQIGAYAYLECSAKTKDVSHIKEEHLSLHLCAGRARGLRDGNTSGTASAQEAAQEVRHAVRGGG